MNDYKELLAKVYAASNNGLDIILNELPQAAKCRDNVKAKFKLRNENDASACLLSPTATRNYWAVCDYGGPEGERFLSPLDIVKRQRGLTFMVALQTLAVEWGVDMQLNRSVNKPIIYKRPATPEELDGQETLILRNGISPEGLAVWGHGATIEVLEKLGWSEVEHIVITKDRTTIVKTRTEGYPIFRQRCWYNVDKNNRAYFDKVYEPLNFNKQYRFHSIGQKPHGYIFGMDAVISESQQHGKLKRVFLVSGGSDAVACWSRGFPAIWMGSERDTFGKKEYKQVMLYCEQLYNIPDIDETGLDEGRKKALELPDMKTIWLTPEDMHNLPDKRGGKRKDLKDYLDLHTEPDTMYKLLARAIMACFWEYVTKKEETILVISPLRINYYLGLQGFYTLQDDSCEAPRYIRMEGIMVSRIVSKTIGTFINRKAELEGWGEEIANKLLRCKDLPTEKRSNLRELPGIDIVKPTATMLPMFFRNCWIKITKDGIERHSYNEISSQYIWKDKIIPHDYREFPKMFDIKHVEDTYELWLNPDVPCKLMKYFWGTSRLHWRKVDEEGIELTAEEKAEEAQCMVSRIANAGYLQHGYKSLIAAYGTVCVDYKVGEKKGQRNGRTGKSIYSKIFEKLTNGAFREGNIQQTLESRFFCGGTTEANGTFIIDECPEGFDFTEWYGRITGDFPVEQKNQPSYNIPFEDSPLLLFATNFVNLDHDPSTEARLWYQVFSDFYHEMTEFNDYKETRKVSDDVGAIIMGNDYPEEDWQRDIAFLIQCVQYHLSLPMNEWRVNPPMGQIRRRELQASVSKSVAEWAEEYLAPEAGNLNRITPTEVVYKKYKSDTGSTMLNRNFTIQLKNYCKLVGLVYNPASITKQDKDGKPWTTYVKECGCSKRCVYIQSDHAVADAQEQAGEYNLQQSVEGDLPF